MQKPKLSAVTICIVGGDGTGKTTHVKRIITDLERKGQKCSYVWFGQPYFLSYPFMFLCGQLGYTQSHQLKDHIVCQEHRYYRNKAVALIWPWIQLADLTILTLAKVRVPTRKGISVVCDRFIPDTMVELMADTNDKLLHKKTVGKLITLLKPRDAVVIRLDTDPERAFARKSDVPDVRFLRNRWECYQIISESMDIKTIDAREPFEDVHSEIMEVLNNQI